VPTRLPAPGPSFLREHELRVRDHTFRIGMARPTTTDDGWWLAIVWVTDDEGIVPLRSFAPAAGPPAEPPLLRLGPALAGELSGWILEEDGRLSIRLSVVAPPDDPSRPWMAPAAMRLAIKFEPLRAAATTPNQLAEVVATAMRRALERLDRP
jgi:hypothetical protein